MKKQKKDFVCFLMMVVAVIMFCSCDDTVSDEQAVSFDYTETEGQITITGYTGTGTDLVIPRLVSGYPVITIGYTAFANNTLITSVEIPDSVVEIGGDAFAGCTSLVSVNLPPLITSIEQGVFYHCSSLPSINLPEELVSIGTYAFQGCAIASVNIPASVESIAGSAFSFCPNLVSVTVQAAEPPELGGDIFYACHPDLQIFVPAGSVDAYTSKGSGWLAYEDKISAQM